jgi:putative glutamine amidotransferase
MESPMDDRRPTIGITPDVVEHEGRVRVQCSMAYLEAIDRAGGVGVVLSALEGLVGAQVALCDGLVLTGGDDPRTERFGVATDARVTPVHPRRQAFEEALLEHVGSTGRALPVLGVCLGMQMMALMAGGRLDQHMPAGVDPGGRHWGREHEIEPSGDGAGGLIGAGRVFSRHRQCVVDPGRLRVLASAPDGVVEAVGDPDRPFHVGVQWHPERTADERLGDRLFGALVEAAGAYALSRAGSASP